MAYAALVSLFHTTDRLLKSSRISVDLSTQKLLKSARWYAHYLRIGLDHNDEIRNNSQDLMAVDARIQNEARRLEDLIESEASAQFLSQSQIVSSFFLNLTQLTDKFDGFEETASEMAAEYSEELQKKNTLHHQRDHEQCSSADCDMVGLSDHFLTIRDDIVRDHAVDEAKYFLITGMADIGKTSFVEKLFNDPLVKEKFECRAFVKVGIKYEYEDIMRAILAQVNAVEIEHENENEDEHEDIYDYFRRRIKNKKFLIVLDDVWNKDLKLYDTGNSCDGSYVFITSRNIPNFVAHHDYHYKMRLLNEDESWELLQRKVFGELQECPYQLVKAGKKIAENCEGLPLLIITVAKLLSEAPMEPEYWDEVAKMRNSVFDDAMDQIYEVLLPSYHNLPQSSKACFIYMGVFPRSCVVRRSRILNLWRAEKFARRVGYILDDIVSNNLLVIIQKDWTGNKAKACKLHVVFRHLCIREGENQKFIHILKSYAADVTIEQMTDKRHLAIYHNTLLAIKEVYESIASLPTLRSLLCTGPYHQYQVPVCLELRLLRVLDTLTIRFHEFPVEVVELIQLRYLSLPCNSNLPPSIKKLWFLEYLIVHQHLSINSTVADQSYVPVEIWELKQLRHLQIIGRNLPLPPHDYAILPDLRELLDVGVQSCVSRVLERIPKLEKLRIQIELEPDVSHFTRCFDHISCLGKLESLVGFVKNPKLFAKPTLPPRLPSISGSDLVKLSLSGFGYPWQEMSKIAELPYLAALKLLGYAFRGEKWEAEEMRFESLEYLLIEDTDLVQWTSSDETFPVLRRLSLRNCHKLREIPRLKTYEEIELIDSNPSLETCARDNASSCDVQVSCSWL